MPGARADNFRQTQMPLALTKFSPCLSCLFRSWTLGNSWASQCDEFDFCGIKRWFWSMFVCFFFLHLRCFASMPYGMTPTVPLVITILVSSITSWQMTQWRFGKSTGEMTGETHSRYWWDASACPKSLWTRTVSIDWHICLCYSVISWSKKSSLNDH